jgi:hypothetical protein
LISHDGINEQSINVDELPVTGMQLVGADSDSPSIIVNKANDNFRYSEIITVTKGQLFANMTVIVQSSKPTFSFDSLGFVVTSKGIFQQSFNNTLVVLDPTMSVYGQLIFAQTQPEVNNLSVQDPCITQLSYSLEGKSWAEIQILVGIYSVSESDNQNSMNPSDLGTLRSNMQNLMSVPDLPLTTFDYEVALQQYNVSYIANRDFELNRKYADDPRFSLVFVNSEVAIFKVETNTTHAKG